MKFRGKKYDTQFASTGKKKIYFLRDMHKLAVNVISTQMTGNKGIKNHGERYVAAMYNKYTQLEDMNLIGELDPDSLKKSHNKGALRSIDLIK